MTALAKKKRRVIIIGDSLLRGTEGPISPPDPSHREFCCLPGAPGWGCCEETPWSGAAF